MLTRFLLLIVSICIGFALVCSHSTAKNKTALVTVSAGDLDRRDVVVTFLLPQDYKGSTYYLRDNRGQTTPLEIDPDRRATFILRELKAGTIKSYSIVERKGFTDNEGAAVHLSSNDDLIDVTLKGKKIFTFVGKPRGLPEPNIKEVFLRGGYIHPVFSPSGRLVTDDYPSDHYHHHGIWFAWTKTEFEGNHPDFWNVADGTGRVDSGGGQITRKRGDVYGSFKSEQFYVALTGPKPRRALTETWDVRVYNVGQESKTPYFLFDITATQVCATTEPLKLEEYRYGGMGLRGNRDWKDKTKVSFLTSEGKTRADGNATRGRWFVMSGPVDGAIVNIAVLDSASNFRSPQPMRLNPDDPFFNYAPSQLGPFEIKFGEPLVLRYRYVVSDGEPDPAQLNRLWNDYANPPTIRIDMK